MSWRRTLLLTLFDLRHSILRLKGLLFLVPFCLYWISMFHSFREFGVEFVTSQQGLVLSTVALKNPELVEILFVNSPSVLSLTLIAAMTTMPFMIMLASNNQLAADAGHGSLRYLLTRCSHTELFVSRFISCTLLVSLTFIIMLAYAVYLSLEIDQFVVSDTIHYASRILLIMVVYALPVIAFMSIFSALFSSTIGALLWGAVTFCVLLGIRFLYTEDIEQLKFILPNLYKNDLLLVNHNDINQYLFYMLIYTIVYASLGWFIFRNRNL